MTELSAERKKAFVKRMSLGGESRQRAVEELHMLGLDYLFRPITTQEKTS